MPLNSQVSSGGPTQGQKASRPSPAASLFLSLGQVLSKEAHYSFPAEAGCQGKENRGGERACAPEHGRAALPGREPSPDFQPTGQAASGDGDGEDATDPFQRDGESG